MNYLRYLNFSERVDLKLPLYLLIKIFEANFLIKLPSDFTIILSSVSSHLKFSVPYCKLSKFLDCL